MDVLEPMPMKFSKRKKQFCEGYSSLLEAMCSGVDIRCETVIGYAKSNPLVDIPQRMKVTNHSWNAVFLGRGMAPR